MIDVDFACSYGEEDVFFLKEQRRAFARKEQDQDTREGRKFIQRRVRGIGLAIEFIEGRQVRTIPDELLWDVKMALTFARDRIEYSHD